MSAWDALWEARRIGPPTSSTLADLMAADGLDSPFSQLTEESWTAGIRYLSQRVGITRDMSVFEVGCGAGAFLYVLDAEGCAVSGIDRSPALIERAGRALPSGRFALSDAAAFDVRPRVDAVVSFGVFMYFRDRRYAKRVLTRMRAKAAAVVAVLDVPDRDRQVDAIRYRERLAGGAEAYATRYRGLEHQYFDRRWMAQELRALGLTEVTVADQEIDGYGNAPHRFNAWGRVPA